VSTNAQKTTFQSTRAQKWLGPADDLYCSVHAFLLDHTLIGTTMAFTVADMEKWTFPHRLDIPPMTGTSCLIIESMVVEEPPSFMDFIAGGGTIGLCVAIDFTQSNGEPSDPSSLHHRSPTGDNEYTRAIRSVGSVLQCYDTDKRFPVYGFGGRINGQVSHAFPLNGNPNNVSARESFRRA
jgi:hypothetical protein